MSKGDNSPGASRFAAVIRQIADRAVDHEPIIDFGTIQSNGSLLTDNFPVPVPTDEYQICRGAGSTRNVRAGDRVLVVWVDVDPVVIDIIQTADEVL